MPARRWLNWSVGRLEQNWGETRKVDLAHRRV
jgi:hypothetical protein